MHQSGAFIIFDVTNVGRLLHSDVLTEALRQRLRQNSESTRQAPLYSQSVLREVSEPAVFGRNVAKQHGATYCYRSVWIS